MSFNLSFSIFASLILTVSCPEIIRYAPQPACLRTAKMPNMLSDAACFAPLYGHVYA